MLLHVSIQSFELLAEDIFYVVDVEDFGRLKQQRTWKVHRRYCHFAILRNVLRKIYPFCILPPLPTQSTIVTTYERRLRSSVPLLKGHDKQELINTHLSSQYVNFAEKMYCLLESFLRHILQHKRLRESEVLLAFLYDNTKWLEISEKYPAVVNAQSISPSISLNANDRSEIVQPWPSEHIDGEGSGGVMAVSACLVNEKLLASRAIGMQTFWHKFSMLVEKLNATALHAHRQHQKLADALCDWAPYENATVLNNANTTAAISNNLRRYANLMDTADEESATLMEHCLLWQNYSKCSIAEVRSAYRKMHVDVNAKYKNDKKQLAAKRAEEDKWEIQSNIKSGRSFLENQIYEAARTVAEETVTFESLHLAGTHDAFTEFATVKLRQAERCHSIWLDILGTLQFAISDLTVPSV